MDATKAERSVLERFFDAYPQGGKLLIVTHDHPDPDSISSAAALAEIAQVLGKAQTTIVYGGIIGRSENAIMVKYLGLILKPISEVNLAEFDKVALVDTQPGTGNNSLPLNVVPDLVIDHHPIIRATKQAPFVDVRLDYGASASILTEYLFKFDLEVSKSLATALLYGIKSETQDLGREARAVDIEAYLRLFPVADKKVLAKIVNSRVPRSYFKFLSVAIQNAYVYGNVVLSRLSEVDNPDIVPEIADLMLRLEGATWSFCAGVYQQSIYFSVRTTNTRKNAGQLMKQLMKGKGKGGGHGLIAGGKIDVPNKEPWEIHNLIDQLEEAFLRATVRKPAQKVSLATMEILKNGR